MKLRKYPVIAPSGREYEVEVTREYVCYGLYEIRLTAYRYEVVSGWFGRRRTKRVEKASCEHWEHEGSDIVQYAKSLVMGCEKAVIDAEKRAASFEDFAKWDGRVSG